MFVQPNVNMRPRQNGRVLLERVDRSTALPYEYDDYFNTRVNRPWAATRCPIVLGVVLILCGIWSLIFASIDIARGSVVNPYSFNPNYIAMGGVPAADSVNLAATWSANSIWPTFGKGVWTGSIMIATGILAICSRQDGSYVGVYVFNIASWITVIFSLYEILSAILPIEAYTYNRVNKRVYAQNMEVAMNALLIVFGVFSFITSLIGAIFSCIYLNYCSNGRSRPKYSPYVVK